MKNLTTPISYYGGKQKMAAIILPLFPPHRTYVEPFFGGGAIFFAKPPSEIEIINDYNEWVANFFQVCRDDFDALKHRIEYTMHSEAAYRESGLVLRGGGDGGKQHSISLAWSFWVQANMSFANGLFKGFAFSMDRNEAKIKENARRKFDWRISCRLEKATIFNRDALDVIERYDSPDTFFYLDPPYAESDCGHYEKGKDVYYQLLEVLPKLKGKWLMSSYPSPLLSELRDAHGWRNIDTIKALSVSGNHNGGKTKTECLTANYILTKQHTLFG